MIFSLVLATYGRKHEVKRFIDNLLLSDFDLHMVELIIVDQNNLIDLSDIIVEFKNTSLLIKHIKSTKLGISYNRNLGIKYAQGKIIAFPDDDCFYYPETLKYVYKYYQQNKSIILGKIYNKDLQQNVLRDWSERNLQYNSLYQVCYKSSSIIMFIPTEVILNFDEDFGVGAKYGSCEDVDIMLREYFDSVLIYYYSDVLVFHPDTKPNSNKLYSYGLGFGALYRKHFSLSMFTLWIAVLSYHILKLPLLICKPAAFKAKLMFISGQIKGFIKYRGN